MSTWTYMDGRQKFQKHPWLWFVRLHAWTNPAPLIVDSVTLTIQRSRAGHCGDSVVKLEIITMTRSNVCLSAPTPPWPENLRTSECSWRDRETGDSEASPTRISHIIKHDSTELCYRGSALRYDFMNNCTSFRQNVTVNRPRVAFREHKKYSSPYVRKF